MYTRLRILEEGQEPLTAVAKDVFHDIMDRKIKWFRFENDVFVVTLVKEENK